MNKKYLLSLPLMALTFLLPGCENAKNDFPDPVDSCSVYFPYQYPVRTIVLGEDEYPTDLDNAHECELQCTMGGSYSGKSFDVSYVVDESLVDGLYLADGVTKIKAMPAEYYTLEKNTFKFDGFRAKVKVHLTDAFFADPASIENTYVIPVRMTDVTGNAKILSGEPLLPGDTPALTNSIYWSVKPQNFMLYMVKFINKYQVNYIRRGVDNLVVDGNASTIVRHKGILNDEVKTDVKTLSLNSVLYPVTVNGQKVDLVLTFDANDKCTVTTKTAGATVSGSGSYQAKSEKNSWNNKDRDGLYLDYNIKIGNTSVSTKDTLVWRDRGVKSEELTPKYLGF